MDAGNHGNLVETHIHTVYSDGSYDAQALVRYVCDLEAQGKPMTLAALTDHNNLNGWEPLQREAVAAWGEGGFPFHFVCGIEVDTCGYDHIPTHLLIYFPGGPDPLTCSKHLQPLARQAMTAVSEENCSSLPLLLGLELLFRELGIDFSATVPAWYDPSDADAAIQKIVSRRRQEIAARKAGDHFVWDPPVLPVTRREALRELYGLPVEVSRLLNGRSPLKNFLLDASESFFQTLNPRLTRGAIETAVAPLYGMLTSKTSEQRERYPDVFDVVHSSVAAPSLLDMVAAARHVGGVPVLAHPIESYLKHGNTTETELYEYINALAETGLAGVECHYPGQDRQCIKRLAAFCQEKGLVVFGGSDFHGKARDLENFGGFSTPESVSLLVGGM